MSLINTKCICHTTGREWAEHLVINDECFQHGTILPDTQFERLSPYGLALYKRYRAPYFSTVESEADWWANHFGLPISPE